MAWLYHGGAHKAAAIEGLQSRTMARLCHGGALKAATMEKPAGCTTAWSCHSGAHRLLPWPGHAMQGLARSPPWRSPQAVPRPGCVIGRAHKAAAIEGPTRPHHGGAHRPHGPTPPSSDRDTHSGPATARSSLSMSHRWQSPLLLAVTFQLTLHGARGLAACSGTQSAHSSGTALRAQHSALF